MTSDTPEKPLYLGIDVGGTNLKIGIVDNSGFSLARVKVPTEAAQGPDHTLQNIYSAVDAALSECGIGIDEIHAVGLATPGTMDIPAGMMLEPPNLPGWHNVPIRQLVADHLQKQTVLQNDANAAAYGEFWAGAGRDANSLVLWTLGTGLGGGIIIGDTIVEGAHSHGSECGHVVIEMNDGRLCGTGQYGTLEAYASATALINRCNEALEDGRDSRLRDRIASGDKLTPILIADAAENGDHLADELIMDTAKYLGVGTTSVMHVVNPDMVLLGGAMTFGRNDTELGRRFLQRVRDEVRQRAFPVPAERTVIDYAALGGDAGYIGAAGCARLKFGGAPGN